MSVKEIDNPNAMKINATRDNAYKIHTYKYIEHVHTYVYNWPLQPLSQDYGLASNMIQINQSQQA